MSEIHAKEAVVRRRYAAGAIERADELCCPVNYKSEYLKIVAVIYRGPFKQVLDDDEHRMERGKRYSVCDKTYNLYKKASYRDSFEFIDPILSTFRSKQRSRSIVCTASCGMRSKPKATIYNATTEVNTKCCDGGSGC